jgi:hypothetical protein
VEHKKRIFVQTFNKGGFSLITFSRNKSGLLYKTYIKNASAKFSFVVPFLFSTCVLFGLVKVFQWLNSQKLHAQCQEDTAHPPDLSAKIYHRLLVRKLIFS